MILNNDPLLNNHIVSNNDLLINNHIANDFK